MEKLNFPEICHDNTQTRPIIQTSNEGTDWGNVPYRPLLDCPQCNGAGFLHPRRLGGLVDYGKVVPCKQPTCLADAYDAYLRGETIKQSGVIALGQTFSNFNANVLGVKNAYKAAWNIAEGMGGVRWFIVYGGTGNGKSHLLNAIANRVMERGIPTRLVMMAELLGELRMTIETHEVDSRLREYKEIPYLLIDEYGLELGSDWEKEKIEELFAARWNHARHTIVATNRDIEELPPRIKSRFKDTILSRWVKNEAGDYRQTRKSK